jgi:hypothetical protein
MIETTRLVFIGQFRPDSFLDFMHHRATRLALCMRAELVRHDMIEVSVAGESDLVDAFELACGLGPIDCLVRDHHRVKPSTRPVSAESHNIELRKSR